MENKNNNLSVINSTQGISTIDSEIVRDQLEAIARFQSVIKASFKENYHMGIIPGTGKKPTLLQPGAQAICTLLNLQPNYEIEEKTRDFDKGFFEYIVKCSLYGNDGVIHAQAIASANSKESKFERDAKFDHQGNRTGIGNMDNTVLKMAQKRALVAASLFIGCLSDVFTQDFDDLPQKDLTGNEAANNSVEYSQEQVITKAQAGRMFAISKGNNDIVKAALNKYGYNLSADVKKKDYEAICNEIEAAANA